MMTPFKVLQPGQLAEHRNLVGEKAPCKPTNGGQMRLLPKVARLIPARLNLGDRTKDIREEKSQTPPALDAKSTK
jgi:hypothetical protein